MCSAFTPDCRFNNSVFKFIGNVFGPNTMCSNILCCTKKTFQSWKKWLPRYSMHAHVSGARCSLRRIKQVCFSWNLAKVFVFFKRRENQFKMFLEMCIVQQDQTKSLFIFEPTKLPASTNAKSAQPAPTCWMFFLATKTWDYVVCLWRDTFHCKKDESWLQIPFFNTFIRQSESSTLDFEPRKTKNIPYME